MSKNSLFNKRTLARFTEIATQYRLADQYKVSTAKVEEFLSTIAGDIELVKSYLDFVNTMPLKQGRPVVNKKGDIFLVKNMQFDFDDKGNPYWKTVTCINHKGTRTELLATEVLPFHPAAEVLFKESK